jgi:tetratricopeptide (TPR) repeat protein
MRGGIPADRYLELLRTNTAQLLGRSNLPDYPASLAATVTIAAERLEADHPGAVAVLRLAAFLGPEPIPTSWLVTARDSLASVPGDAEDIFWPESALTPLGRYGLAVVGSDVFQVHRLTQAVVRETYGEVADAVQDDVAALLIAADPGDPELPGTWSRWAALTSHVTAVLPAIVARAELRPTLLSTARYLVRSAQPHTAHTLAGLLHETWSASLGKDHPDTLRAAHMVTWALDGLGEHAEVLPLVKDILERRQRLLGEDDDTLSSAHDLAVTLSKLGRHKEAYALKADIYKRRRATSSKDAPETLRAAYSLAVSTAGIGKLEKACASLAEILELQRRSLGDNHPHTLDTAHQLANTLRPIGRLDESQRLITDVLERRQNILGEDHPLTLRARHSFGLGLGQLDRYDESYSVLIDTLERLRRALGDNHPDTLNAEDSVGMALTGLGRHAEAEQVLRRTRTRVQGILGEEHSLYRIITKHLANALEAQGRTFEAAKLRTSARRKGTSKKRKS